MLGFDSLGGIPLHPLVVHFPVVLSVLLPISVLGALWVIRKGTTPRRAWALPLAVATALTVSAYVATETGEHEEDRVERVVTERALHGHEEAAERFLVLSGLLLLVAGVGLVPRTVGQAARLVTAVGAVGLLAAGVQVGHSGGELVYRHGAAGAYTDARGARRGPASVATAPADARERAEADDR
ncbi:MAG: DUF2231 domain-containing protein [Gemmatirosa sp.]